MKNLTRVLFLTVIFTGLVFTGCQDALDVTFEADYTTELPIVVTPSTLKATNGAFASSTTIDPMSNGNMSTYANNIQSVRIVEATATILSVSTEAVMSAELDVTSGTLPAASWVFTDEQIVEGAVIELSNENGQLDKISDILSAKNVFTVDVVGQTDQDDITFTISVTIRAFVTANPL
jgi:hypothetical protein